MTANKDKSSPTYNKRKCFLSEFESLLQTCSNATGIPEPAPLNHFEDTGNYMVYLSKLTKRSSNHGS